MKALIRVILCFQEELGGETVHPEPNTHSYLNRSSTDRGAGFSLRATGSAQTCHWQGWRRQRAPCPCPCCHACACACVCACASSSSSCAHGDGGDGARCVERTEPP